MVQDLSHSEERRSWRRAFVWGAAIALVLGIVALVATPLVTTVIPNRTGQDTVATSLPREPAKAVERAKVETKSSAEYGPYLTDGYGRTLYIFDMDQRGKEDQPAISKCYDNCAKSWPPLLSEGRPESKAEVNAELLSTIDRKDGSHQVTYSGWPLYRFVRDAGPKTTTGQGLKDFGGEWRLIAPSGDEVQPGSPSG
jgi:predicted lipoprotein with Yx(FWY)xxD motif